MKTLSAALLAGLVAFPAFAQAPATSPIYDVEVLIFENRQPELEAGELWLRENVTVAPSDLAQALEPALAPSDAPLTKVADELTKDGEHRVLLHRRWSQVPEAKSATRPVRLQSADRTMDGMMRFYISRFLHVELNLVMGEAPISLERLDEYSGQLYRLNEHRRVRSQEYHYFDHPKFGVLVRVTQVGKT